MSVYSGSKSRRTTSSILRKSTSLRTQLTEIVNTPSKVRFVLPHSQHVQDIVVAFLKDEHNRDYSRLVCTIRDAEFLENDALMLLKEVNDCVSLLNDRLRLFVEAVLNLKWLDFGDKVKKQYQNFVVNVLSAHNCHAKCIMEYFIELFLTPPTENEWLDGTVPNSDAKRCKKIHGILKTLLTKVPMCKLILLKTLKHKYPYYMRPAHMHEYYLYNILLITNYVPSLRSDIIYTVISKLVSMDVNIKNEDIFSLGAEDMDWEGEASSPKESRAKRFKKSLEVTGIAHSLDICLDRLYNCLYDYCHYPETGEIHWKNTKELYQDMLSIFDTVLLPTYSKYVQFVMFVLCSYKEILAQSFLDYLWKKVCNPNVPSVLRQAAATYIASFLSRATYLPLSALKELLKQMSDWAHLYISNQDGLDTINPDTRIHLVFYSVCQAIFYLVAAMHTSLFRKKKSILFLESLNLGKIVTCKLNPLKVCQPWIVQNFASVTRTFQLVYCYTIIERNSRQVMPTVYQDEKGTALVSENILSNYFPFEPYLLPRSSSKVNQYYRNHSLDPGNG